MSHAGGYYLGAAAVFHLGRTAAVAFEHRGCHAIQLDPTTLRLIGSCNGAKSLDAHALNLIALTGTADLAGLRSALIGLHAQGLLREFAIAPRNTSIEPEARKPIESVVIVSADRPEELARCLRSVIRMSNRSSERPRRILVIDGSQKHAARTADITNQARVMAECSVEYVGRRQGNKVQSDLIESGIPSNVVRFGISAGGIGSNRNLALVLTAGEKMVMIDDDIVIEPWGYESPSDSMTLGGHDDPREWRFFRTRSEAIRPDQACDLDILGAHAGVMGLSLARLAEVHVRLKLDGACAHLLTALSTGAPRNVHVTMSGLAGDSGRYCPRRLLMLEGPIRDYLVNDHDAFRLALSSREVRRAVRELTVTHDPACQSHFMGIWNRRMPPPFMPQGRGEDSVFGLLLNYAYPPSLFAHLPHGVVHDSLRQSKYNADELMPSARCTRISEFLAAMIVGAFRSTFVEQAAERLRRMGQNLQDIRTMGITDFRALMIRTSLHSRSLECAAIERVADQVRGPHSESWRTAAAEYLSVLRTNVGSADFFVPAEFVDCGGHDEGLRRAQEFVGNFGELLEWWPKIWDAARNRT